MSSKVLRVTAVLFLFAMIVKSGVGKATKLPTKKCSRSCNLKNGFCHPDGSCRCFEGWKGENCNQCERAVGCRHGTCNEPDQCICIKGYGGRHCQLDMKYCERHHPCQHGGICSNDGKGSYTCKCPENFYGRTCALQTTNIIKPSIAIRNNQARFCLNGGRCSNEECESCECLKGFSGIRCQTRINMCLMRPCANGGSCQDLGGDFICQCSNGFVGKHCDQDVNECSLLGRKACKNGGRCENLRGSYTCHCQNGFEGARCEKLVHRIRRPTITPKTTRSPPSHHVPENMFRNKNKFFTDDQIETKSESTNLKIRHSVIYSRVEVESLDPNVLLDNNEVENPSISSSNSLVQILTFSLLGVGVFISLIMTLIVCLRYFKNKKGELWHQQCFHEKPGKETNLENNANFKSVVNKTNRDYANVIKTSAVQTHKHENDFCSTALPCETTKLQHTVDNLYVALPEDRNILNSNNRNSILSTSDSNCLLNSRSAIHSSRPSYCV